MSFEIVFLIFVVAFMILSHILKQIAKRSGESDKPVSVWRLRLQQVLKELQREMEGGRKEASPETDKPAGRARWWEELMQPEARTGRTEAEAEETVPHRKEEPAEPLSPRRDSFYERDWSRSGPERASIKVPPKVFPPQTRARLSRRSLRQAVIWSEILGKPVALRNRGAGHDLY